MLCLHVLGRYHFGDRQDHECYNISISISTYCFFLITYKSFFLKYLFKKKKIRL